MNVSKSLLRVCSSSAGSSLKRTFMSTRERLTSEALALRDPDLELIINKSDASDSLLLQSIFDRQAQEYIHRHCDLPVERNDRYMYRVNSLIIHHPSDFDELGKLPNRNRFVAHAEYARFSVFLLNVLSQARDRCSTP